MTSTGPSGGPSMALILMYGFISCREDWIDEVLEEAFNRRVQVLQTSPAIEFCERHWFYFGLALCGLFS